MTATIRSCHTSKFSLLESSLPTDEKKILSLALSRLIRVSRLEIICKSGRLVLRYC